MVTLNTSNSKSMNNAYAVAFHQGAYEQINTAGASALGIDSKLLYDYHSAIIALNDAVLGTQGSDKTAGSTNGGGSSSGGSKVDL